MKKTLTKNDSLALKGIAIILMLWHHCFCEVVRFDGYNVDFSPLNQQFVVDVTFYFKICVSIFAFITGFGLYYSAKKECHDIKSTNKWMLSRYIKTFSGFWLIYIISFIATFFVDRLPVKTYCEKGNIRGFAYAVSDFLGLANLLDTPNLNGTWWYMSAAIVFIIMVPLVLKLKDKIGYVVIIALVVIAPRLFNVGYPGGINAFAFVIPVLLGMIFAEYDVFAKIEDLRIVKNKAFNSIIIFFIAFVLLILSFVFGIRLQRDKFWELLYGVFPLVFIIFAKKYIVRIPILDKILIFLGKHSMNVFLIHTFFRHYYLKDFIYGLEKFWLMPLMLLVLSLPISIVIELLKKLTGFDKLVNKVCKKIMK